MEFQIKAMNNKIFATLIGLLLDYTGSWLFVFSAVCQLLHQVLS